MINACDNLISTVPGHLAAPSALPVCSGIKHPSIAKLGTRFGIKKLANFEKIDRVGFASPISTTCRSRIFDKYVVRLVDHG